MNEKVLSYNNALLRGRDKNLLEGNNWLNDQVTASHAVFSALESQHGHAVLQSHKLDFQNATEVFLPL